MLIRQYANQVTLAVKASLREKKKHQFIKTVIQKNGHQTRSLGYVQKICVTNFLEYFVDNVKQPFFFLVANPLIKQVSSCSQFLNY